MPVQPSDGLAVLAAHIDESAVRLSAGFRVYGLAAVLTSTSEHARIVSALHELRLPGRTFLHHYDETPERRCQIAEAVANLALDGAVILTEATTDQHQERARAHLLTQMLPRLQYVEQVSNVVIESRAGSDKHDRRVRDRLRRSRHITADLRVNHARKQTDPLLWIPDFVVGAWFSARYHQEAAPWATLSASHYIEVTGAQDGLR
ncbi:hypothetical protein [Amycolatopsis anabasis]|uniref:hypothetical protein n=1 Tax=Amycolatopsis anabasis TaxID=1840409 RepID=UPI00131D5F5C|nr:hypothetical protein [Amycolatopsis anabasis]